MARARTFVMFRSRFASVMLAAAASMRAFAGESLTAYNNRVSEARLRALSDERRRRELRDIPGRHKVAGMGRDKAATFAVKTGKRHAERMRREAAIAIRNAHARCHLPYRGSPLRQRRAHGRIW